MYSMRPLFLFLTFVIPFAVACTTNVVEVRTASRPPRDESCELQIIQVTPEETRQGGKYGPGGEYEQIGMITLAAMGDTNAMSDMVKAAVRPRACAMGGEYVSLLTSAIGASGMGVPYQATTYQVWAKRAPAPPASQTPQPF